MDNVKVARELVRIARVLIGSQSNLEKANSYYRVVRPFPVYVLVGHEPSNAYYGRSQIQKPIWEKVMAKSGDLIENLYGGLFYSGRAGKRMDVHVKEPEFAPFERTRTYDKFPMDKLEKIEKP